MDRIKELTKLLVEAYDLREHRNELKELALWSERRVDEPLLPRLAVAMLPAAKLDFATLSPPFHAHRGLDQVLIVHHDRSRKTAVYGGEEPFRQFFVSVAGINSISPLGSMTATLPDVGIGPVVDGRQYYLVKRHTKMGKSHECINWMYENHIKFITRGDYLGGQKEYYFGERTVFRYLQIEIPDDSQRLHFQLKWC